MGLDMYLFKKSKNIKQKILNSLNDESDYKEVAYWRKDYFIHEWFCYNFNVENCNYNEISKEDLLSLIEYIKSEEDEDRKEDIKILNKIIEETDWENEEIYYWAWW